MKTDLETMKADLKKYRWFFFWAGLSIFCGLVSSLLSGCCVVAENRVFPKLDWYWSKDCKQQRFYDQWEKQQKTNNSPRL